MSRGFRGICRFSENPLRSLARGRCASCIQNKEMLKEVNELISKYGGISQFQEKASQAEKEKYFLIKRAVTIEYNDYKFNHRNMIDSFVHKYVNEKSDINEIVIKEDDDNYSLFSKIKFMGESNIINSDIYKIKRFSNYIEFESLHQFLIFQKSVLFLDEKSANEAIKTNNWNKLTKIDENIKNFNNTVWTEFKTKILEKGVFNLFKSNANLHQKFLNLKEDIFVFESNFENWGVINSYDFMNNELMKHFNYKNYFGKILTRIKIEKK